MLHVIAIPVLLLAGAFLILGSIAGVLGWLKGGLIGTVLIAAGTVLFFTI